MEAEGVNTYLSSFQQNQNHSQAPSSGTFRPQNMAYSQSAVSYQQQQQQQVGMSNDMYSASTQRLHQTANVHSSAVGLSISEGTQSVSSTSGAQLSTNGSFISVTDAAMVSTGAVRSASMLTNSSTDIIHPIQVKLQQYTYDSSSKTSPGSLSTPESKSSPVSYAPVKISLKPIHTDGKVEIPLIRHTSTLPHFDSKKHPEHFGETFAGVFARVFLLQQAHGRLTLSYTHPYVFDAMILYGIGVLMRGYPGLRYHFLKHRGEAMNYVTHDLSNINDENAMPLQIISTVLTCSSVYLRDVPMKDHFSMCQGPSALIIASFQEPEKFPKSLNTLKNIADGLRFTSRYVYHPAYDHKLLHEFLEVVTEFGANFLNDEDLIDSDDEIHTHYESLVDFIEFSLEFMEKEKSNKHVLRFPVNKLYSLLQNWYECVPSGAYAVNSKTRPVDKVIYAFWNALAEVLAEILVGARYIFTFLFNGFHCLFPLSMDALLGGLEDNYRVYANYCCRLMAFMTRRRHFIVRNTVLNDPIPAFFDEKDRFKPRMFDIEEGYISRFRTTLLQRFHYPSETFTAKPRNSGHNYYKGAAAQSSRNTAMLVNVENLSLNKDGDERVDMLDFNNETGLLNKDFDPRSTDPIFNDVLQFQPADLDFIKKYNEDMKLIIQLDT